jgi:hypothetical protein
MLAVAGLVSGCGSSSSTSSTAAAKASLSESEFAAQTGALACSIEAETKALEKEKPTSTEALPAYVTREVTIVEAGKAKIAALVPPAEKQAAFTKYLGLLGTTITKLKELGQAITNPQRAEAIHKEFTSVAAEGKALEKEAGVAECPTKSATSTGETTSGSSETQTSTGESTTGASEAQTSTGEAQAPASTGETP